MSTEVLLESLRGSLKNATGEVDASVNLPWAYWGYRDDGKVEHFQHRPLTIPIYCTETPKGFCKTP